MKARDSAFMVDPRRQMPVVSSGKKDAGAVRKKVAPVNKPKAASATPANGGKQSKKQQQQVQTGGAALPAAKPAVKKGPTPKQTKAAKAAKNATVATAATTTERAVDAAVVDPLALPRACNMGQEGVKSRNHRLFLAPNAARLQNQKNQPSWSHGASSTRKQTVAERLHLEILEYAKYTKATVDAMAVHIEEMIAQVRSCVLPLWSHAKIETFGSYSTGIWLPSSDVDLVILDVVEMNDRASIVRNLRELAQALRSKSWVASLTLLETAKIPVLKLVSAGSSVPIDITFESSATHSGLLARDLVKRYADELPELYPLAIVFKQLLRERDLNDAYTGGLSSYSIVLMLIHFSLLWRNGHYCFEAASVYASGAQAPTPAQMAKRMLAEKAEAQRIAELERARAAAAAAKTTGSPSKAPATSTGATSSYASIVARSKTPKESISAEASPASPPPFSYAAVAAGKVKLSEDESRKKAAAPAAPNSYAAAVAAAASSKPRAKAPWNGAGMPPAKPAPASQTTSTCGSPVKDVASIADVQLDLVSVSSSSAETEDTSSERSSSSTTEELEEDAAVVQNRRSVTCLGEHTMRILEFFGILFDYRKNGLSIRDGGYIYQLADHGNDLAKPALVIEDPIHPDRNVSASSFAFSKVVAVFEDSHYALKYFRPSRFAPSVLSCLLNCSGHTDSHPEPTAASTSS
ncbi:TPA: hypothetical protein N0F65_009916 [Lagenidium giganteum]|uniref:Polymerase nucleotidyl transferase domain-containing protein n=1 Tax=Lagenidium giganteum TaxID=4803 RepID=A0AAV2YM73_9STRA|nr:TPA: hypothetical protein N0F65_009916 [Lagenidium giganteum]